MNKKSISVEKTDAVEYMRSFLTEEEKTVLDFQTKLICQFIEARKKHGISQRKLAELTEMKQPSIAKIEKEVTCPQINTLIKLLLPLGKTLAVVPIEK